MSIALLYEPIYLIVVAILTFIAMGQYNQKTIENQARIYTTRYPIALFIAIVLIIVIGFRPQTSVFVDMVNYISIYNAFQGESFVFDFDAENIIFDNIFHYWASNRLGITSFFVLISAIYWGGLLVACKKLFPRDTLLAYVMYLGAFSTFSYGVNGIKAGAAAAVFLIALAYRERVFLSLLIALISYGCHHAMQVVVVAYIITFFFKNPKYYLYGWIVCFMMGLLHITFFQEFFGGLTDEQGQMYLINDGPDEISGFRIDFILYSALPVFLGYRIIKKYNIQSKFYIQIINLYTLVNGVWLLCLYANDINRIAYLSWLMYPFVLLYPFVNLNWSKRQGTYLKYTVFGHLGFTLFMFFIYYGLIRG